jgi:phage gp36-like protein
MNYISINDLLIEFSSQELAKLTGDPTGNHINTNRIELAIMQAQSEVDAYLSDSYLLPLSNVPDLIKYLTYELTVYIIYSQYYKNSEITEQVKWRRLNAQSILKLLKNNEIIINADKKANRIITVNTDDINEYELSILKRDFF